MDGTLLLLPRDATSTQLSFPCARKRLVRTAHFSNPISSSSSSSVRLFCAQRENQSSKMGNCQAIDAASLVIQHPNGKEERLYWPVMAKEVMKSNPGHYVALLITFRVAEEMEVEGIHKKSSETNHHQNNSVNNGGVRITRVKLLRPTDTLVLGQAYRLIDTQEVMKGLWAKKFAKMNKKKKQLESTEKTLHNKVNENQGSGCCDETETNRPESGEMMNQAPKLEKHRQRTSSAAAALARSRAWRPSLQSISEGQGVS